MIILNLLRTHWLPLTLLIIAGLLYFVGYGNGVDSCERKAKAAQDAAIIEQQEIAKQEQGKVIDISNALALKLDDARKNNKKLEGKLYAERQKPAYINCLYDNDGVQLYRSIIKN